MSNTTQTPPIEDSGFSWGGLFDGAIDFGRDALNVYLESQEERRPVNPELGNQSALFQGATAEAANGSVPVQQAPSMMNNYLLYGGIIFVALLLFILLIKVL